ncbi:hypothetical protein SEA_CAMBIARE_57 [Mycobacterium phage Cambiare]|uniref:Uncharacterized protein n=2 Tax=Avocadovirus TaxID=2946813 RepID=A0A222YYB9_9CAUD|nr:hypothetical protein AVT48_gp57 [Mycobacterium phage Cambiare]YP_010051530.1 hypothetical protein KDW73_gp58 [Mycobacterium phage Avocado]AKF14559.1 hypothetical protein SEA_CAMBIARE_57 [Mycobacterium phage Cambiare]ASR77259.1 hypothetical protein SEA_AVOCADO_58 [Mycobacterium phage Avocado]
MTQTATTATAPEFIGVTTYHGRAVKYFNDPARLGWAPAGTLAAQFGAGVEFPMWEYFGQNDAGQLMFSRTRFVADEAGNLHGYDSTGRKVIIHPADRRVRFLAQK